MTSRPQRCRRIGRTPLSSLNEGTVPHEFVIERLGATHEPLVAGDQMAMVEGIVPGESRTLTWTFAEPDSYQLACHAPGHYEAGQVLVIEVAD